MVRNEQQELQGWVLADGISVDLLRKEENGSFFGFFIDLIACYYAWDLTYPIAMSFCIFSRLCGQRYPRFSEEQRLQNLRKTIFEHFVECFSILKNLFIYSSNFWNATVKFT